MGRSAENRLTAPRRDRPTDPYAVRCLPPSGAVEAAACSPFAAAERARPPVKFFLVTDDPSMRVTAAAALGADSLINIQEIPERPRSCCDVMLRLRCLCSFRVAAWPSSF
jgi:hypothetical protein